MSKKKLEALKTGKEELFYLKTKCLPANPLTEYHIMQVIGLKPYKS